MQPKQGEVTLSWSGTKWMRITCATYCLEQKTAWFPQSDFLFGLASSPDYTSKLIILAGVVLIMVEALSMGVGAYLSETGTNEIEKRKKPKGSPAADGVGMFFSYFIFGMIVLSPYALFSVPVARYSSIALSLALLFVIGYLPTKRFKSGIRMLILAGLATIVGFLVARIFWCAIISQHIWASITNKTSFLKTEKTERICQRQSNVCTNAARKHKQLSCVWTGCAPVHHSQN